MERKKLLKKYKNYGEYRHIKGGLTGYKLVKQAAQSLDIAATLAVRCGDMQALKEISDAWMHMAAAVTTDDDDKKKPGEAEDSTASTRIIGFTYDSEIIA